MAIGRREPAPLLASAVPTMMGLQNLGDGAAAGEPVLCHNNLNPGNVHPGQGGRLIVTGSEHANGLPPELELSAALASWAVNPNGGINGAGARAILEGYLRRAGSLPALSLGTFRGAAMGLQDYVAGQVSWAPTQPVPTMSGTRTEACGICTLHLPSAAAYERVLEAAVVLT